MEQKDLETLARFALHLMDRITRLETATKPKAKPVAKPDKHQVYRAKRRNDPARYAAYLETKRQYRARLRRLANAAARFGIV